MSTPNAKEIASTWLQSFAQSLYSSDVKGVTAAFLPDGWLRDELVFTWSNRSLEGHVKILEYLQDTLSKPRISDVQLDERPHLAPYLGPVTPMHTGLGSAFTFQTKDAVGRGYFRLVQADGTGEWKALSVYFTLDDIKGHEESGPELGVYGGHTLSWESVKRDRVEYVEKNPQVLIIGSGQTGLNVAARFKQMNIPTIVVDRLPRVGDVWRNRYPTLTLHTPQGQHQMLYHPYPRTWPKFTPRDKLADWFEQYAVSQDLVVWTNSTLLPSPKYNTETRRWTVRINRNGTEVEVNPSHIVVAAGTLGAPRIPSYPGQDAFKGTIIHTGIFKGARAFKGKRVLVVGAGNTSADVCQDLVFQGAKSVTMVQRSSTCVVSSKSVVSGLETLWPPNVPTEIADFKLSSMPFGLMRNIMIANEEHSWKEHEEMHDGLRKAGLKLNMGIGGAGQWGLVHQRLGGYWIDVGCAEQIINGNIKIKQGVEVERFSDNAVSFTDGSSIEADAVIFATGYHDIRDTMRDLFGDAVIDQTAPIWGLDEEGESKGSHRPSGYPGLWFATGDFYFSRYYSKRMALHIKAQELGLCPS
ncbi:hypothetical protein ONZ45_g4911 [Pleurotus djamor]|nr:hypothetical protein ONZ45_g4911 [Pleurotus djamor]